MKRGLIYTLTLTCIFCMLVHTGTGTEIIEDSWYLLTFGEAYLGYMHSSIHKGDWQGQTMIKTYLETELTISRMGMDIKAALNSLYVDDLNLEPAYFRSEISMSSMKTITEGTVSQKKLNVTQIVGGQEQKKTILLADNTIFPSAKFREIIPGKLKIGEELQLNIFIPDFLKTINHSLKVVRKEKIQIEGQEIEVYKTVSMNEVMPSNPTTEWIDEQGHILLFESPMMGTVIRGIKTTKANALNKKEKPVSAELFSTFLIKPKNPIVSPGNLTKARYLMKFKNPSTKVELPESNGQRIIVRDSASLILEISKQFLPNSQTPKIPITDELYRKYVLPTSFLQSDDPELSKQARQIIGQETSALGAAIKICSWVYGTIKKKNLSIGFASASEVLRIKEGDCSEHSVLTAALLRAVGIPARLCIGLVYSTEIKAFGYHMWVEFWAGSWYQIDPTLKQVEPDVTHIFFYRGDMEGEDLIKASAQLNNYVANIELDLVFQE